MSRRKDDNDNDITAIRVNPSKFSFSKPVTELSKKAEEEVNHLTNNNDRNKLNSTLHQKSNLVQTLKNASLAEPDTPRNVNITDDDREGTLKATTVSQTQHSQISNFTRKSDLIKIDDTLQNLADSKNIASDKRSSPVFLQKLRTQITSMSPDKGG